MTCIVGLEHEGKIYIGGDSAGVGGLSLTIRADEKVFKNGNMLFGFTSSFRMGQLLRFKLQIPYHRPEVNDYQYMVTDFIDAVRYCLKEGGYASVHSGEESGGTFLVGYKGKLYEINDDYQVGMPLDGYAAVGCGEDIAKGAMYANIGLEPEKRILNALGASENFSAGVRSPFHVLSI